MPRDSRRIVIGSPQAKGMIFWGPPTGYTYNEIDVHDYASERTGSINIHLKNLDENGEGNYVINESNCQDQIDSPFTDNISCRIYDPKAGFYKWYCSSENSGVITITKYDTINFIVSGTFSCTARNRDDPDEVIEITEGRFDIKWDTLDETDFP